MTRGKIIIKNKGLKMVETYQNSDATIEQIVLICQQAFDNSTLIGEIAGNILINFDCNYIFNIDYYYIIDIQKKELFQFEAVSNWDKGTTRKGKKLNHIKF